MKRLLILILAILGCATLADGQVARQGQVIAASGRPVAGANIWVCSGNVTVTLTASPPCTPSQVIFADFGETQQVTQPLLTDGNGNYLYYTQSGTVTEAVTGNGIVGYSAVLTLAPGNSALKPAPTDLVFYVSQTGSDFNDGSSIGSAFGTLSHANSVAIANGGGSIFESGTVSFSSPLVLGSNSGAINRNIALYCMGVPGLANNAAGVLNYTGTSGIAISMNQGVYISKACRLQGPGTGTPQGVFLGQTSAGAQSNNFFSSHLEDWTITGFPGGGLIVGFYVYIDQLQNVYLQNNGGLDLQWASGSTSGENLSWNGGAATETGSSFNTSCALISGAAAINHVSFDQCGMTVSVASGSGPAHVDCGWCHLENPNGTTTSDFLTITGTGPSIVGLSYTTIQEDGSGAGRTEFIKANSTGSGDVITVIGGQYTSQESGIPLINNTATSANVYCFGPQMQNLNACSNSYGTNGFAASPTDGVKANGITIGAGAAMTSTGAGGTSASVTGALSVGHVAVFNDTVGTIKDGGSIQTGVTDFAIGTGIFLEAGNGIICTAASNTCAFYIFPNAHTIVRVVTNTATAPVTCGTNAKYGVYDLTAASILSSLTPTVTGILDSGAISVSVPAGHTIGVGVVLSGSGCATNASAAVNATVE